MLADCRFGTLANAAASLAPNAVNHHGPPLIFFPW